MQKQFQHVHDEIFRNISLETWPNGKHYPENARKVKYDHTEKGLHVYTVTYLMPSLICL